MITKYAVYNPKNGQHVFCDSAEEAVEQFWTIAMEISLPLFHNTCYMTVEQKDDGSEVWRNDENKEITRPRTRQEIIEATKKFTNRALPEIDVNPLSMSMSLCSLAEKTTKS